MLKEVRIESSKGKRNPEDFVLWKPALETDDPFSKFESPFGLGRPGWHIECSAMSHKYLGETFDIHGGGADLIFPHHTNEIAQTCCAFPGAEFAKTWVHNGFLTVDHEKMSKSLGNFTTVEDLIKTGINGETARLFLLGNHYRKPIDYNKKAITDSEKTLSYWYRAIEDYDQIEIQKKLPKDFIDSLLEDMNISKAVKIINDFAKEIYSTKNENPKKLAASNLVSCARFLGLMNLSSSAWFRSSEDSSHIDVLITQRLEAKQNKNWALADQIRKKLSDMEIEIEDTKDGLTQWRRKN